jgi:hypothetical protein
MFTNVLILLLVVNACFWGLAQHGTHCSVIPSGVPCPPHYVHLLMSVSSFVAAVAVAQWSYVKHVTGL